MHTNRVNRWRCHTMTNVSHHNPEGCRLRIGAAAVPLTQNRDSDTCCYKHKTRYYPEWLPLPDRSGSPFYYYQTELQVKYLFRL